MIQKKKKRKLKYSKYNRRKKEKIKKIEKHLQEKGNTIEELNNVIKEKPSNCIDKIWEMRDKFFNQNKEIDEEKMKNENKNPQ